MSYLTGLKTFIIGLLVAFSIDAYAAPKLRVLVVYTGDATTTIETGPPIVTYNRFRGMRNDHQSNYL